MRQWEYARRPLHTDGGAEVMVRYFILMEGDAADAHYGIAVALGTEESTDIPRISPQFRRVEGLIHLLARNTVTPCTVGDVVADWL